MAQVGSRRPFADRHTYGRSFMIRAYAEKIGERGSVKSALFSPYRMRDLELENRVTVAPMCMYAANDGVASDWHLLHYGSLAVSGPGLVILEATGVERPGRISHLCLGIYS